MAKGGIYKSEVFRARAKLLAQGINPSIDAVRIELGNTGSKTTIHRYLKEIEEEEGASSTGKKVSVSDAIQNMVDTLATRLHEEAEVRVTEAAERNKAILAQKDAELAAMRREIETLKKTLADTQAALSNEAARLKETANTLRSETLERARFQQQVADLQDRLTEEAALRQSLEEKHQQAREALEHFRSAAKEQREQEQRQHEQQVQYLQSEVKTMRDLLVQKQSEIATSNKECARLVTELSQAERSLQDARGELRALKDAKAELTSARQQLDQLGHRVVESEAQAKLLEERNRELAIERAEDQTQLQQLQIELAAARATIEAQEQLAEKIQTWMAQQKTDSSGQTTNRPSR